MFWNSSATLSFVGMLTRLTVTLDVLKSQMGDIYILGETRLTVTLDVLK